MIMKGQKINGRYQIIKSIGEGGMANVYLAYDTILDRNVAIKVLRGDLSNDEKFVRRFQREALSASSLSHPNIVEVYDVGEDAGQYYIVMEYIEGKHLKNLIKKRGALTIPEVIDIMLQVTDGLSVAHDSYIIHRDIKPQNIMILENGLIKITDFGIAMAINATQLTQTNSVMGSVHYLPPEQASGKGSTLKSDIYSMGILMYELLTGKLPYRGDNAVEIALKHLKEPMPSIKAEIPNLPQSIENIILKATAKNPKNRYNDAREMYEDLKTCLESSRAKEKPIVFKYSEAENEDLKIAKPLKSKEITAEEDTLEAATEPIAKQLSEADYTKKQNKIVLTLASIFAGLIVVVACIVLLLPQISNRKEIKIKDVQGKTVAQAVEILQDQGFKVADEQKEISDPDIPAGKVVKTNPVAGLKKAKGSLITLYVSTGEAAYTMEDFTGQNYLTVKGKLEAYGIYVIIEKKELTEEQKAEEATVIDQSVKAGEKVAAKDTVTLYIPDIASEYPNFADGTYTTAEVADFCEKYGVTLKTELVETDEYEEGTIIYQNKPEGYTVVAGVTLIIKVATPLSTEDPENHEGCQYNKLDDTWYCD